MHGNRQNRTAFSTHVSSDIKAYLTRGEIEINLGSLTNKGKTMLIGGGADSRMTRNKHSIVTDKFLLDALHLLAQWQSGHWRMVFSPLVLILYGALLIRLCVFLSFSAALCWRRKYK